MGAPTPAIEDDSMEQDFQNQNQNPLINVNARKTGPNSKRFSAYFRFYRRLKLRRC